MQRSSKGSPSTSGRKHNRKKINDCEKSKKMEFLEGMGSTSFRVIKGKERALHLVNTHSESEEIQCNATAHSRHFTNATLFDGFCGDFFLTIRHKVIFFVMHRRKLSAVCI